jgi:hypothetical protein
MTLIKPSPMLQEAIDNMRRAILDEDEKFIAWRKATQAKNDANKAWEEAVKAENKIESPPEE